MFGKEYAQHLDVLIHSFGQMNKSYLRKAHEEKYTGFIGTSKKLFISLFGIPEIGFQLRSIYFEKILTSFVPFDKPKRILDAGSGIGAYAFWLAKKFPFAQVTGADVDKQKLNFCRTLMKEYLLDNISFNYFDISKTIKNETYDLIVIIDVLEHIDDYPDVLRNCYRLLRKNGILYIHVPQPNQKRIFGSLRRWRHKDHVRAGISKETLEKTLTKIGFKIIVSRETFGLFGKLAWELNHLTFTKNFVLAALAFPFLYIISSLDPVWENKNGLGVAVLSKK